MLFSAAQETEKIIAELNETWEEKLRRTEAIRMERWVAGKPRTPALQPGPPLLGVAVPSHPATLAPSPMAPLT